MALLNNVDIGTRLDYRAHSNVTLAEIACFNNNHDQS